jgi:hypothetical protein
MSKTVPTVIQELEKSTKLPSLPAATATLRKIELSKSN